MREPRLGGRTMKAVLTQFYNEDYEQIGFDFVCKECGLSGNGLACKHWNDSKVKHSRLGKEISLKELDTEYYKRHPKDADALEDAP